jgi:hypothetical protein
MSIATEQEIEDPKTAAVPAEEAKAERPADPRRAKPVLDALRHAAKRDPAYDVLKPVGRGAFLIWAVVLVGLVATSGLTPMRTELKVAQDAWSVTAKTYNGLTGSASERAATFKKLDRNPEMIAKVTIATFAAGTGVLAGYYALFYLLGLPMMRAAAATGRSLHRRVLQPAWRAAGRAIERDRERRLERSHATSAGTEPKLQ